MSSIYPANNISFLAELLLLDLGILGMDRIQFDDIVARTYQPPLNAPDIAQQLIPLLTQTNYNQRQTTNSH